MLSDQQIDRYSRQIILPEVGARGQERLRAASLAVVDGGGDSALLLLYLAAAGIGRVTVYNPLGRPDWDRHVRDTGDLNSDCDIELCKGERTLDADTPELLLLSEGALLQGALVNTACIRAGKPLIWSRSHGAVGYLGVSAVEARTGCYACAAPTLDLDAAPPRPPAAAILATIQAGEAISHLLGTGSSLDGSILRVDAAAGAFTKVEAIRSDICAACGTREPR